MTASLLYFRGRNTICNSVSVCLASIQIGYTNSPADLGHLSTHVIKRGSTNFELPAKQNRRTYNDQTTDGANFLCKVGTRRASIGEDGRRYRQN